MNQNNQLFGVGKDAKGPGGRVPPGNRYVGDRVGKAGRPYFFIRVFYVPGGRWVILSKLAKEKGLDPDLIWGRWNALNRPIKVNDELFKAPYEWKMEEVVHRIEQSAYGKRDLSGAKVTRLLTSRKVLLLDSIRPITQYQGNDGVWYTAQDLAKVTGASRGRIYQRIKKYGLTSPKVLEPASATHRTSKPGKRGGAIGPTGARDGSEEYKSLQDRDRGHLLANIPSPGSWELGRF